MAIETLPTLRLEAHRLVHRARRHAFPLVGTPRARLAALALLAAAACGPLHAQDRMVRRYAAGQGFGGAPVAALAQDGRGFLWIGGEDGLYRYDGTAFRRWASDTVEGPVRAIATVGARHVVVMTERGRVYDIAATGARELAAPLPEGAGEPNALTFDARGQLWMVRGGRIGFQDAGGDWHLMPDDAFGGESPRFVRASPSGSIAVATARGVWEWQPRGVPVKRLEASWVADFTLLANGAVAAIDSALRIVGDAGVRAVDPFRDAEVRPRPIAIVERGGTIWGAYDRFLVALRADRPVEIMGPDQGIESGGPLMVDREGSLWMGTFTALLQYPEPETRIWNERTGLHSQHTRFIARAGSAVWVTTWQGTVLIEPERGTSRWLREWHSQGDLCEDAAGGVWFEVAEGVVRASQGRIARRHPGRGWVQLRCTRDGGDGVWFVLGSRLFRGDARMVARVGAPSLPPEFGPVLSILDGSDAELWIGGEEMGCRGALAGPDTVGAWYCAGLPNAGKVLALARSSGGQLLAATSRGGIYTWRDGGWTPAPLNEALPSRALLNLIPSPSGGIWVLGHGLVWRVEDSGPDGSWVVRERLGEWHGLPLESGRDLHEDVDGRLWITTSLGVIEVPGTVRSPIRQAPHAELVDVLVDEAPVATGVGLELPYDRNLELRFAVLSYRDPGRLRYQVRLSPGAEWREASGRPWFRWIDMPPRTYRAELRASLDGELWTAVPAALSFRVRPAWYRTSPALGAFAVSAALLLWAAYRARVGYLVGLERERTRIAMDLHDEMGSGLGSIGILSGLLASRGIDDGRGRDLASRIARTAQDLGGSLSGIIWSLDARSSTLAELASRLAEAGGNLLAAQGIEFRAEFPGPFPQDALSPRARRNLMLLGLEALHNAARHSLARNVTLAVRRAGGQWEVRVADDGRGFDPSASHGGRGLGTIRRRAEEIGASIEWHTAPGQGTAVVVRFTLRSIRARPSSGAFETSGRSVPHSRAASASVRSPDRIAGGPA